MKNQTNNVEKYTATEDKKRTRRVWDNHLGLKVHITRVPSSFLVIVRWFLYIISVCVWWFFPYSSLRFTELSSLFWVFCVRVWCIWQTIIDNLFKRRILSPSKLRAFDARWTALSLLQSFISIWIQYQISTRLLLLLLLPKYFFFLLVLSLSLSCSFYHSKCWNFSVLYATSFGR